MDTESYLSMLSQLLQHDTQAALPVTGSSMVPFLVHGRDQVLLQPPPPALHRGDIALYRRENGHYVLHRVCRTDENGRYYFVGDAQQVIEGPIAPQQILAAAVQACRKGKWIGPGDFWWDFFASAWLLLRPVRRPILMLYGRLALLRRGRKR